jgi:hypothetical protein
MKTQSPEGSTLTLCPLRTRLAAGEESPDSYGTKSQAWGHPVPVDESGRPLGWIERTLLAVDSNRVFIEVSDPRLRADLTAEYEAENRDVIVAKDSQTLLKFMEQLPVPAAPANDMVIAGEDSSGETVSDLRRQLKARGWSIPVFTVWAAAERQ